MRLLTGLVKSDCDIYLHSDSHEGTMNCHTDGIDKLVDEVASNKKAYWVHLGDAIEAITTDDKRFSSETNREPIPLKQARSARDRYAKISKKCLAWLKGNHEESLSRFGDLTESVICEGRLYPYGGYVCKLALSDKHGALHKQFLYHGPRMARLSSNAKDHTQRIANMKAALRRCLENKACDCLVMAMGHTHKLLVSEPHPRLLMSDDGTKLVQHYLRVGDESANYIEPDCRWYCNTGSYLKSSIMGADSYAEIAGYDPIELGHLVVRVRDRKVVAIDRVVV